MGFDRHPAHASVMTVTSQPSPAAWIAGIATQISVNRPAMISCLRPVALTASTTFWSSQVLTQRPVDHLLVREDVGDLREDEPTSVSEHAREDGRDVEGLGGLRQRRRIVDRHMRVVTVQVRELVRLVVDQNEYRVFGTKKRSKAVTKGHYTSFAAVSERHWFRGRHAPAGDVAWTQFAVPFGDAVVP